MAFTRVNPSSWSVGDLLLSSQANQLDINVSKALDKSTAGDTLSGVITMASTAEIVAGFVGNVQANAPGAIEANTNDSVTATVPNAITPGSVAGGISSAVSGGIQSLIANGIESTVAGGISSNVAGGIQLAGGSSDWVKFSSNRTRHVVYGMNPQAIIGAWTGNLGILNGGATTDIITIPLRMHDGTTLSNVALGFTVINPHSSISGMIFPGFSIIRRAIDGTIGGLFSTGTQHATAATGAAWYNSGNPQILSANPDQNNVIDVSTYHYYMVLTDENGTNSISGNQYFAINLTFSSIADTRFQ